MSTLLTNAETLAHQRLYLEEVSFVVKMESMRKSCGSLVILDCEENLLAFSVPVLLKQSLIESHTLVSLELSAGADILLIKFFLHA